MRKIKKVNKSLRRSIDSINNPALPEKKQMEIDQQLAIYDASRAIDKGILSAIVSYIFAYTYMQFYHNADFSFYDVLQQNLQEFNTLKDNHYNTTKDIDSEHDHLVDPLARFFRFAADCEPETNSPVVKKVLLDVEGYIRKGNYTLNDWFDTLQDAFDDCSRIGEVKIDYSKKTILASNLTSSIVNYLSLSLASSVVEPINLKQYRKNKNLNINAANRLVNDLKAANYKTKVIHTISLPPLLGFCVYGLKQFYDYTTQPNANQETTEKNISTILLGMTAFQVLFFLFISAPKLYYLVTKYLENLRVEHPKENILTDWTNVTHKWSIHETDESHFFITPNTQSAYEDEQYASLLKDLHSCFVDHGICAEIKNSAILIDKSANYSELKLESFQKDIKNIFKAHSTKKEQEPEASFIKNNKTSMGETKWSINNDQWITELEAIFPGVMIKLQQDKFITYQIEKDNVNVKELMETNRKLKKHLEKYNLANIGIISEGSAFVIKILPLDNLDSLEHLKPQPIKSNTMPDNADDFFVDLDLQFVGQRHDKSKESKEEKEDESKTQLQNLEDFLAQLIGRSIKNLLVVDSDNMVSIHSSAKSISVYDFNVPSDILLEKLFDSLDSVLVKDKSQLRLQSFSIIQNYLTDENIQLMQTNLFDRLRDYSSNKKELKLEEAETTRKESSVFTTTNTLFNPFATGLKIKKAEGITITLAQVKDNLQYHCAHFLMLAEIEKPNASELAAAMFNLIRIYLNLSHIIFPNLSGDPFGIARTYLRKQTNFESWQDHIKQHLYVIKNFSTILEKEDLVTASIVVMNELNKIITESDREAIKQRSYKGHQIDKRALDIYDGMLEDLKPSENLTDRQAFLFLHSLIGKHKSDNAIKGQGANDPQRAIHLGIGHGGLHLNADQYIKLLYDNWSPYLEFKIETAPSFNIK